jgi:hypothetical protein
MTALERELLRDSDAESIDDEEEEEEHKQTVEVHQNDHHNKTVSDGVREKLHNHILKHGHDDNGQNGSSDEPDAKRPRIVGNGVISPKCNGDLNNKTRTPSSGQQPTKAENGTPNPQGGSGMTAVA